jgi:2-oxo-4-hydroxy-4-carboxy--5-ureidoimidazoline (OHCU) decarboxylase
MNKEITFDQLSEEKQRKFEELTEEYSNILQLIDLFIQVNELDYDEAWDKANQRYDSDMSYAPNE